MTIVSKKENKNLGLKNYQVVTLGEDIRWYTITRGPFQRWVSLLKCFASPSRNGSKPQTKTKIKVIERNTRLMKLVRILLTEFHIRISYCFRTRGFIFKRII